MNDDFEVQLKPEPDYSLMLSYLAELIEKRRELPIPLEEPWVIDAQILSIKIFKHLYSLRQMMQGVDSELYSGQRFLMYDHSSINLLVRGVIESYLVLNYLYVSDSKSLIELRHCTWFYAGLLERQSQTAKMQKHIDKLRVEKQLMESLKARIESNVLFKAYGIKVQEKLLSGSWRGFKTWGDLAEGAGYSKKYFKEIYGYLCGYSHSSYACMMQIASASSNHLTQQKLAQISMGIANVTLALLIKDLKFCIPHSDDIKISEELTTIQNRWLNIASQMKHRY